MKFVLGFDGGGTKTECVAMDPSGTVIARGRGPASNPTRIGFDAAASGVNQAARATLAKLSEPADILAMCAGLAGTAQPQNRDRMQSLLEEAFPGVGITVCTDLDLALAGMPEGPAMVLVVGTGSAALGRDGAGRQLREGGYGPSGSDEGSAFDIGRRALSASRPAAAGDAGAELSRQILRHLGCADWAAVDTKASLAADDVYPRVFPVVAASADAGNSLAQSVLDEAAQKLAAIALRLADALDIAKTKFPLGRTGGTVGRSQFFDQALVSRLRAKLPNAVIGPVPEEAALTAARIALRQAVGREEATR
jgi:N-acetylglucosamine kinase-like BadF-type ATPase